MSIDEVVEVDIEVDCATPGPTIQGLLIASKDVIGNWAPYKEVMALQRTKVLTGFITVVEA